VTLTPLAEQIFEEEFGKISPLNISLSGSQKNGKEVYVASGAR
jgi:hypothetical protein